MSRFSFSTAPRLSRNRSKFDLSHGVYTSMNVGKLVPLDVIEVLPGDTFDLTAVTVTNVSTAFQRPVKDNLVLDIFYFFDPSRIEFGDWAEIFGENNDSAWARKTEKFVPQTQGKVFSYTVADYMGLPVGVTFPQSSISVIPFRGFANIYNEWFRNENVVDPMHIRRGPVFNSEFLNNLPWGPSNYTGQLPNVSKVKDYFTACLPAPQKGDSVSFSSLEGILPVKNFDPAVGLGISTIPNEYHLNPKLYSQNSDGDLEGLPSSFNLGTVSSGSSTIPNTLRYGLNSQSQFNPSGNLYMALGVDVSAAGSINVNDLRIAVQTQKLLERAARGGTRYREYLLSAYGVQNGDMRMQVPEYLAGGRIPIKIQTVVQSNAQETSEGSSVQSPLGRLAGFSETAGSARAIKSFGEHGFLFILGVLRQAKHSYQQGTSKMWLRRSQLDFYDPLFQSIGEQPVYVSELYTEADGSNLKTDVFGYNEAWAEYRFLPNKVTGQMRSGVQDSFDIWHFGDYYDNAPSLTQNFIEENSKNVDRTLAAPSTAVQSFLVDLYLHINAYRELPVRSYPGYVDHY